MSGVTRNTKLESNWFTGYLPNFAVTSKIKHFAKSVSNSLTSLFTAQPLATRDLHSGIRPPGQVSVPEVGQELEHAPLSSARPIHIASNETRKDLPVIPLDEVNTAWRYWDIMGTSERVDTPPPRAAESPDTPSQPKSALERLNERYRSEEDGVDPLVDPFKEAQELLPETVLHSSLINRIRVDDVKKGEIHDRIHTHLADPRTGFSSSILYDRQNKELIISFSGLGATKGKGIKQFFRVAMNWLGFRPKNISQASALTKEVKAHIDRFNEGKPENEKIKLSLTGFSMGGALASYASLRNGVPAVVFNPMQLGIGCRARIGDDMLRKADQYLTQIVVQGDLISDTVASKVYVPLEKLGINSRGPLGTARRFMVPWPKGQNGARHLGVATGLYRYQQLHNDFSNLSARLKNHGDNPKLSKAFVASDLSKTLSTLLDKDIPEQATREDLAASVEEMYFLKRNVTEENKGNYLKSAGKTLDLLVARGAMTKTGDVYAINEAIRESQPDLFALAADIKGFFTR
jgi:hypothetical protein